MFKSVRRGDCYSVEGVGKARKGRRGKRGMFAVDFVDSFLPCGGTV